MILIISLFILFGIWTLLMINGHLKKYDDKVYSLINIKDLYTIFFKIVTTFGSAKFFVLISLLLLIFLHNRLSLILVFLLIIEAIIVGILKAIIRRERPNIRRLVQEKNHSYPSGHTTSSTIFYGFLIFLILMSALPISIKIILIMGLSMLILLVGFSRIYLGVHYFSDVIGGMLLGFSYLLLYIEVVNKILNLI